MGDPSLHVLCISGISSTSDKLVRLCRLCSLFSFWISFSISWGNHGMIFLFCLKSLLGMINSFLKCDARSSRFHFLLTYTLRKMFSYTLVLMSNDEMSWSEMPGMTSTRLHSAGWCVKNKSMVLLVAAVVRAGSYIN